MKKSQIANLIRISGRRLNFAPAENGQAYVCDAAGTWLIKCPAAVVDAAKAKGADVVPRATLPDAWKSCAAAAQPDAGRIARPAALILRRSSGEIVPLIDADTGAPLAYVAAAKLDALAPLGLRCAGPLKPVYIVGDGCIGFLLPVRVGPAPEDWKNDVRALAAALEGGTGE